MLDRLLGRLADNRQVQASADDLRDLSNRQALVGNPVIPGSRDSLLKRRPEEAGSVERCTAGKRLSPSPTYAETPF
jgi:hypothetical protein